jgi:Ca2+-binding RTX toxin-like protein
MSGEAGNDTLTGGSGADRFVLDSAPGVTNVDTIADFTSGVDTIALSHTIFTSLGAAGTRTAADGNVLIYNASTGEVSYDADGAGGGAAVVVAILGTSSHPASLGADFLIV